jgi:hypothetical protein
MAGISCHNGGANRHYQQPVLPVVAVLSINSSTAMDIEDPYVVFTQI